MAAPGERQRGASRGIPPQASFGLPKRSRVDNEQPWSVLRGGTMNLLRVRPLETVDSSRLDAPPGKATRPWGQVKCHTLRPEKSRGTQDLS